MEKIYSKVQQGLLLHIINRVEDITEQRKDLSDPDEFLQVATLKLPEGKTFYPHKHIWKDARPRCVAQESWIIIKGRIRVILYDLNDKILKEDILTTGDASITFFGGHNYECLEEGSLVYEMKSSRYEGVDKDKVAIK